MSKVGEKKSITRADVSPTALREWYPVGIKQDGEDILVDWGDFGCVKFTDPFFEDTLRSIPSSARERRRTSIDNALQFSRSEGVDPSGFIYHASRSGSTLVAQMLATLSRCVVISEAPVIDAAVQLCRQRGGDDHGLEILRAVVRALGQRRFGAEHHLFVKLDSWHIAYFQYLRDAFPRTPCFFLYRRPLEILASHRRQPGRQMVPGFLDPEFFELASRSIRPSDLDTYTLRVMSRFYVLAGRHAERGELKLINFDELPSAVWNRIAGSCGLRLTERDVRLMQRRSTRHSKRPAEPFVTPGGEDRRAVKRDDGGKSYEEALLDAESSYEALERTSNAPANPPGS